MSLIPYAGKDDGTGQIDDNQFVIGRRQDEMLSYLQGLAPVGEPFEFNRRQAIADLGFGTLTSIYQSLYRLEKRGLIRREYGSLFPKRGALVVLTRLEHLQ